VAAGRTVAAGLTEPRGASERSLAMGGERPAERRFTVGGSGKSVARCHRTVLAYWKFESISLQQRGARTSVREPDEMRNGGSCSLRRCLKSSPLISCAVTLPPFAPAVVMRRYPMAAAMRDMAVVRVGVTRARAERAGHGADRAADDRPRCGAAATAGNTTDRGAHPGAHQPAADIELCIGRRRREQHDCHASRRKQ
jgi:hypothetical protein